MPAVRRALIDRPELRRKLGDLHVRALDAWIRFAVGTKLATAQAIRLQVAELQRELGGPGCPMVEGLIVQQISVSWVQAQYAHMAYLNVANGSPKPELLAAAVQRQANAQRRLLTALKQLAVVRKLLKPAPSAFELLARTSPEAKPKFGGRLAEKERLPVGSN